MILGMITQTFRFAKPGLNVQRLVECSAVGKNV